MSHNIFYIVLSIVFLILNGIGIYDLLQNKHALWKNYPLLGRLRWVAEGLRPKIMQYFVENNLNGTPISRENRSVVYQRSKLENDKVPFGTEHNVYDNGYEFISHSMYPKNYKNIVEPRVLVGSKHIKSQYSASIFNISAMSFGALSAAAVESLNKGAALGNFYHNTGEGGISDYHKKGGGIVYQIGTGYFGCGITIDGVRYFNDEKFMETFNSTSTIKMIEIKNSQGSKPSLGGILPASKNTEEIAKIRGVEKGTEVNSPPYHSAYSNNEELLDFIERLRNLTNRSIPIGIKMCVGSKHEVENLFKTFHNTKNYPDFMTIDGGEGGTGASPLEFTNYVGMPLLDALHIVKKEKDYYQLNDMKIIASGKVTNAFDIIKLIAIGADMVNAARSYMLSLGCIMARECHSNTCPSGVATQNPRLSKGLNPTDKSVRVYNYHNETIHILKELLAAMGIDKTSDISKNMLNRRVDGVIKSFGDLYN